MKKNTIAVLASASLLFGGFSSLGEQDAHAESLKEKIHEVKEKREENKSTRDKVKVEIEKIKHNQDLLDTEIKKLDQQVSETENKIDTKEGEISKTKEDIEKLKSEIDVLVKRIEERDKMLKDRVTAMYENGGSVQYIEVLLGSKSFADFLDRVFALNEIAEQDKEILEAHKADKTKLEETKMKVEEKLEVLNQQMKELERLKQSLKQKVDRKNELLSELKEEEEHMHEELGNLEDEADLLQKQQAAFEAEKRRQEEAARLAAKRAAEKRAAEKRAAEKRAAEKRAAEKRATAKVEKKSSNTSSKSHKASKTPKTTKKSAPNGGMFIKPSNGYFTSGFGPRWGRMHPGIDIAKGGTVPIVASASGTVIKSYYSSSYGNVIFIAHYLNGQTYTTVNAHLRDRYVGNGSSVQKGQKIGIMGNTGRSTGQHLHFEIHKGQWNSSKSNAVNPRKFF
ncbi:murein hydrolase activator EnvC family protein [Pseudalkalibacillus salsuginis]|uniref:murein hydrolase activator EnvC family protein n=1 Tax=Pseudalkalibacillus salsuginis TaxID=2910972 RepID=UPI001F1D41B6|nr:M23 family metallopeptidase [Pseudalkalibacillus salsuginis]MCF6410207.1 peptidoglycan DD-metalloendopeptidase family protein [Pseudalkalibacillus salsuginis]